MHRKSFICLLEAGSNTAALQGDLPRYEILRVVVHNLGVILVEAGTQMGLNSCQSNGICNSLS